MKKKILWPRLLCAASIPLLSVSLQALQFYGLTQSGDRLLSFNQSGVVSSSVAITGLQPGDSFVDIDVFFSGDGKLYGLGGSGTLYTLNKNTGAASVNVPNAAVGTPTAIDFNPAADRLRIFSGDANYRLTPGSGVVTPDGTLAFAAGDANEGAAPNLVAAAYINNFDMPATTALYSIDANLNALVLHSEGPQFSTLNTLGMLTLNGVPFDIGNLVGFDVFSAGAGNNSAFLSNGNDLYSLDLESAALSLLGTINTSEPLRSIAVSNVPEGGNLLPVFLTAVAGLCFFGGRRALP